MPLPAEKAEFLKSEDRRKKKVKWIIIVVLLLVIAGIVAGTAAGVLLNKNDNDKSTSGGSSAGNSAGGKGGANGGGGLDIDADKDFELNGDLNKDSPEIKKLMANKDLKKVFHGIDYTPLGTIYPECKYSSSPPLSSHHPLTFLRHALARVSKQHYPRPRHHVTTHRQDSSVRQRL